MHSNSFFYNSNTKQTNFFDDFSLKLLHNKPFHNFPTLVFVVKCVAMYKNKNPFFPIIKQTQLNKIVE